MLAVLALGPATILMGATFPALVRHFSSTAALSQAFGRLYSANTIGAVIGTLSAGLVLIELFGLSGALAIGATCSLIAGLTAIWLSRGRAEPAAGEPAAGEAPEPARQALASSVTERTRIPWLPLAIAFISGLTSLGYQVTWTRLLASGTGG